MDSTSPVDVVRIKEEDVWIEDVDEFNFEDFPTANDTQGASIICWSNFKQEIDNDNNLDRANGSSFNIGINPSTTTTASKNLDSNFTPNFPSTSSTGGEMIDGQRSQLLRHILDRPSRTASCGISGCGTANNDLLFEKMELTAQRAEIKSLKAIINSLKARIEARDETILHKDEIIEKQTEEINRLRNMDHYCAQCLSADPLPKMTPQQQHLQPQRPPPSLSTTSQSSSDGDHADAQKCRLIQHRLILLLHAQRCQMRDNLAPGHQSQCTRSNCREMKSLLNHMARCGQVKACTFTQCSTSFQILSHWKKCQALNCAICVPIKVMAKSILDKANKDQLARLNVDHHHHQKQQQQ